MPRVLFLMYHGTGHFNACFKIASILQTEFEVAFAGLGFFKKNVEDQNFRYHSLRTVPFGLGFERWIKKYLLAHFKRPVDQSTLQTKKSRASTPLRRSKT